MDLRAEFPGVVFVEGPAAALDGSGNPYRTYSIGGLRENDNDLTPSMVNATDEMVWRTFVANFARALGANKRVVVRRWPQMDKEQVLVLNTFDAGTPTLAPLTKIKVTGRFTFYPE